MSVIIYPKTTFYWICFYGILVKERCSILTQ